MNSLGSLKNVVSCVTNHFPFYSFLILSHSWRKPITVVVSVLVTKMPLLWPTIDCSFGQASLMGLQPLHLIQTQQ